LSHSVRSMLVEHVLTPKPTPPVLAVLSWAGMRGVISLAVALSLPQITAQGEPFPGRELIVFIAFAVILVTLIGQGLTLPAVISRLGVAKAGGGQGQEISAQLHMARVALEGLDAIATETGAAAEAVNRVTSFYIDRIERLERQRRTGTGNSSDDTDDTGLHRATHDLLERLLDLERAELQRMQNSAIVDNLVVRRLQRSLDLLRLRDHVTSRTGSTTPRGP
jgi:hypothetical protein